MPLNKNIHKVMIIGSGPIVIGQAAEFDYAGNQACKALKAQGLEVVLVNSNPATLMTDHVMADEIYLEPLNVETLQRIIEKEKPDSLLSTLGGQTGLTLSMELAKSGFLESHGVQLLGARPLTIDKAEDRQMFKDTMEAIGEPCIPSKVVTDYDDALDFAKNKIGFPVIIRPAFTLGGTGGGIAYNEKEFDEIAHNGLHRSPIHQILVEKCISGWKEVEFEVMRDHAGNVLTVCSMENFDPVGVHTGDSIVIAPTVTLADKEYQMLRSAALNIISALEIEGGCNCQFALNPETFEYAVIEVNPRVSRSSALASKATGYPIAKVAALIAVGYNLDEIPNFVTGKTKACFEPVLDYVVVKVPKFPFEKFVYAARKLGTQMKATGEVMAIGQNFEEAILKAIRGAELGVKDLNLAAFAKENEEKIRERVGKCTDQRIFAIYQALKRKIMSVDEIHEVTKIDEWFLYKLENIAEAEKKAVANSAPTVHAPMLYPPASFKMVDTCAGEFSAESPYFYSTTGGENEAEKFLEGLEKEGKRSKKGTIIVLGSGPIRIGQGIEFDYASVQCVWSLKKLGYEVAIINNNPETVSTDFDTADRLYFEPLTPVDVMNVIKVEKPVGVVVAFGGQTAIKLTKYLDGQGIRILGTSADGIDLAEDRERFEELCERLHVNRPKGQTVFTEVEALEAAARLTYPVLMRPSYVLGGQNMIIARTNADIKEYMKIILAQGITNPVLIDKYMEGTELEVDCICDGEDVLIPGIMEHVERTGIHSGDSIAVYPAWNFTDEMTKTVVEKSRDMALALGTQGLVNIQWLFYNGQLNIIEANPRSSRTVPYLSKVTGIPMVELATRAMLGEKVRDMGYGTGLYRKPDYYAVKVPVFSFEKLMDVDTHLGPEMKSTGEVLGIAKTREEAIFKGMVAAGWKMIHPALAKKGEPTGVLFSVRKSDRPELPALAKKYSDLGFTLYATEGNADTIERSGMKVTKVNKVHENYSENVMTLLESGKICYVVSTSAKGRDPSSESVRLRRLAVEHDIDCLTAIDTANALADSLSGKFTDLNTTLVDINKLLH
ncbi:carbamoyl-phosphate synthase large subunit [uncultured Treponema sp.]|uniref:carbamoyl-phosphate synthase large subunit n=1 Tax=uncultured Treponema sp. TaxID=162155 RepID=UPI00258EA6CA|nr:carbamoyl-phosphate synthase large subunit [uncultured Treponema sp.]